MAATAQTELGRLIADRGWQGILVLAESAQEPDVCRFTRGRHLGLMMLWVDADGTATLVYFVDMEREEAAATGATTYGPQDLGLAALRAETASRGELLARAALRLWRTLGIGPGAIGVGGRLRTGDTADLLRVLGERAWLVDNADSLLGSWRRCKLDWERELAREAASATCGAFLHVAEVLRRAAGERVTAGDLRRVVATHFAHRGLEQPQGNIVAIGPEAGVPHSAGEDDTPVAPGQTVVVDLFPRSLVFADCSRTFCLPPIPASVTAAHETLCHALETGRAACRPGVKVSNLVNGVLTAIEERGYPTLRTDKTTRRGMVHSLGHGLGFDLHEAPHLRARSRSSLRVGDLITIEPGLYDPRDGWGIRLEDMLLIEEEEVSNLTPLPLDLDPTAWPEPATGDPVA